MDISNISFRLDLSEAIEEQLRDCGAFIVIIGREWLSLRNGQRRIDQEDDYVRVEIATAIARNIPIIPVLVQDASMPREDQLPADLQPIVTRQALQITDVYFDDDILRLIETLARTLGDEHPPNADKLPVTQDTSPDVVPNADFVFISYDRDDDEEFALQLAAKIKEHGVNVWVDQWNLEPSEDWDRSIDDALNRCARFLIVLSPSSVDSDEVRGELRFALDEKKPIVPVLYKDCSIPRRLRLTQHADFRTRSLDDEAEMNELLKALKGRRK